MEFSSKYNYEVCSGQSGEVQLNCNERKLARTLSNFHFIRFPLKTFFYPLSSSGLFDLREKYDRKERLTWKYVHLLNDSYESFVHNNKNKFNSYFHKIGSIILKILPKVFIFCSSSSWVYLICRPLLWTRWIRLIDTAHLWSSVAQ